MTKNNGNNLSCAFAEELVSYLYGEMPVTQKTKFEIHLSGCAPCTEEFAGLSLARLGVYEWQRDEFAHLATPRFVIPFEDCSTQSSWIGKLIGTLAFMPKWAMAGGAFAVLAVGLGLAFFASSIVRDSNDVAENKTANVQSANANRTINIEPTPILPQRETASSDKPKSSDSDKVLEPRSSKVSRHVAAKQKTKGSENASDQQITNREKENQVTQRQNAPRLNNFDDEEDNTLRLADLFAEVDSRK